MAIVCLVAGLAVLVPAGRLGWRIVQDNRVDARHERQLREACDDLWMITAAREPQEIANHANLVLDMFSAGTHLFPGSGPDLARLRNPVQDLDDLYRWTNESEWTAEDTERAYMLAETAQLEASRARQSYCTF